MSLERISLAADSVRDQQLQDAISRVTREIANELVLSYGKPTPIIYSDYGPKLGDMVRVDPSGGAFTVKLPGFDRGDEGKSITIVNIGTSTNTVTIGAADGLVNGASSQTVAKSKFIRQATAVNAITREWILTTVMDGNTSAAEEPFWEWNGTDLTQFLSPVDALYSSVSSVSVVSVYGLSWIRMTVVATASGAYQESKLSLLPMDITPPSANYRVTYEARGSTLPGGIAVTYGGAACRWTAGTGAGDYYVAYSEMDPGSTTGSRITYVDDGDYSDGLTPNHNPISWTSTEHVVPCGIRCEGASVITSKVGGVDWGWTEPSGAIAAAGRPALVVGASGAYTVAVDFRRIQCWEVM